MAHSSWLERNVIQDWEVIETELALFILASIDHCLDGCTSFTALWIARCHRKDASERFDVFVVRKNEMYSIIDSHVRCRSIYAVNASHTDWTACATWPVYFQLWRKSIDRNEESYWSRLGAHHSRSSQWRSSGHCSQSRNLSSHTKYDDHTHPSSFSFEHPSYPLRL